MNANAKKWIEDLRSGEFQQTWGSLHRVGNDGPPAGYCCLGVACERFRRETGQGFWQQPDADSGFNPNEMDFIAYEGDQPKSVSKLVLPNVVQAWLGLSSTNGIYRKANNVEVSSLIDDNDAGDTFTKIADIIESEPKGLFCEA